MHRTDIKTAFHTMSAAVFLTLLFAASLHASWNAIVKAGRHKLMTTVLVTSSAALISLVVLPFLAQPNISSWKFIGISVLLQVIYFSLIAKTYHIADMALTYPLMRGFAPFIVAILATHLLGERLHPYAWCGIIALCFGILSMIAAAKHKNWHGIAFAILNACVIASYTLIDGIGVRLSNSPIAYTLWIYLLTGLILSAWIIVQHKKQFFHYSQQNWHLGLIGGAGSIVSYGLALWAMTLYPVAIVAALRETSILFALLISVFILKEQASISRIISSLFIVIGAVILRLI